MTKTKDYAFENWIALDVIWKVSKRKINSMKKMEIISNFIQTQSLFLQNISNNCQNNSSPC